MDAVSHTDKRIGKGEREKKERTEGEGAFGVRVEDVILNFSELRDKRSYC